MIRKFKNYALISMAVVCAVLSGLKLFGIVYEAVTFGLTREYAWYGKHVVYGFAFLVLAVSLYWKGKDDLEEINDEREESQ